MFIKKLVYCSLLLAVFTISCEKEAIETEVIKTALEAKMEAQGWKLVEGANFVPFEVSPQNLKTKLGLDSLDVEYFVAVDEKQVFIRKGFNTSPDNLDLSPPDFNGVPDDFDPKAFAEMMEETKVDDLSKRIIGTDTRSPVTSTTTLRSYPWRSVGALVGCEDCVEPGCTGTLIGPRHVLTAAHCLYGENGWYGNVYFSPGQLGRADGVSGTPYRPNGSARRIKYYYARSRDNVSFDYGMGITVDEARTASLGWFGIDWYNLGDYDNFYSNTAGYPGYDNTCNYSPKSSDLCGGYMYQQGSKRIKDAQSTYLTYEFDTQGGQSGSPVYRVLSNGSPVVLAVHRGPRNSSENYGSRLRPSVYNDLCNWMGNWPSHYASHPCTD